MALWIPYKLVYTKDDMKRFFYPVIISEYRQGVDYTDYDYVKNLNDFVIRNIVRVDQLMNSIFNDESGLQNTNPEDIFNIKEARKELFASSYYILPKTFKFWLSRPNINKDILVAIKDFLLFGRISFEVESYQINPYLTSRKNQLAITYYNNLFLIDGDNLYSHIVPLFNLKHIGNFVVFYKRANISPFFAAYKDKTHFEYIDVVQTEQSRKDAADMSISRYVSMMTADVNKVRHNQQIYIITGDESSQEIIRMTNNYLNFNYVNRINSQLVGIPYNPWNISNYVNVFPRSIYGDLIYKQDLGNTLPTRSDINYFNFKEYLYGSGASTNNTNIIASSWVISLMKLFVDNVTEFSVENIIRGNNINSIEQFLRYLEGSRFSNELIMEYKDQLLKILGSKFFTMSELSRIFMSDIILVVNQIKTILKRLNTNKIDLDPINDYLKMEKKQFNIVSLKKEYQRNQYEIDFFQRYSVYNELYRLTLEFGILNPENTDFLRVYYKFLNPLELYINYIDFNIILGITDLEIKIEGMSEFDQDPQRNILLNIEYFPERIQLKSITFQ